jgi:hypothetical protein
MKQRPFWDQRPSMSTNVLLQHPKLGQVIQTTRSLPDEQFAHTPRYRDDHGVREIFQNWATLEQPSLSARDHSARRHTSVRQDFVATNRAALRAGCVTAGEFRDFKKRHTILTKSELNLDAEDDAYDREVRRAMIHGTPTPVATEIRDTLTWQFGREAVDRARERQTMRQSIPAESLKPKVASARVRWTKAARGEAVKPESPATIADTFKIRRFAEIGRYAIDDTCPARA